MKKIILVIIGVLILIGFMVFYQKSKWIKVDQEITKTGYKISINYDNKKWDIQKGDGNYSLGYSGGFTLKNIENEDIYMLFSYKFENNGDDTPQQVGDTGAPEWPPQRDELVQPFESDEYTYIGTYLGKKLYVTGYNTYGSSVVVQKLDDGMVTGTMPLLSSDQERINYFDYFGIDANYGTDPKQQKELHKEFLKILKTLKIEKIEK